MRYKPAPDKWCIQEILGHLADIEIVYGIPFAPDARGQEAGDRADGPERLGSEPRPLETPPAELVALYGLNRHANLRLLQRLKPADLASRPIIRKPKQDFTVAQLVERMATHGASHLEQIERLKKDAGKRLTQELDVRASSPEPKRAEDARLIMVWSGCELHQRIQFCGGRAGIDGSGPPAAVHLAGVRLCQQPPTRRRRSTGLRPGEAISLSAENFTNDGGVDHGVPTQISLREQPA